jgi:hypothetical protein
VPTRPIQPVHPNGSKPPIWRRWWAVIIYAIVLVLIGVSIGSSGKTATNTAASKPGPAATDTIFKTLPGPTVEAPDYQISAYPDRHQIGADPDCDGLAFAAAWAARVAAIIGCRWWRRGRRFVPSAQQ